MSCFMLFHHVSRFTRCSHFLLFFLRDRCFIRYPSVFCGLAFNRVLYLIGLSAFMSTMSPLRRYNMKLRTYRCSSAFIYQINFYCSLLCEHYVGVLQRCIVSMLVRYGALQCVTTVRYADSLRWCVTLWVTICETVVRCSALRPCVTLVRYDGGRVTQWVTT